MQSPIKRLLEPLFIKVDFTERYWDISPAQARAWLIGAIVADLSVQALVGLPNLLTVLASMLTAVIFWTVPARLSGAVGGLYISQALGSLVVVSIVAMSEVKLVVELAAILWWAWCMFAFVKLILGYIRTPKSQF